VKIGKGNMMVSVEFNDVTFQYSKSVAPVLENFNWKATKPASIALLGENGAGKSTFLRLLAGFLDCSSGEIRINGRKVKGVDSIKQQVTFLPENSKLFLVGPTPKKDLMRIVDDENKVNKLYSRFDVQHLSDKKLYELSEGQRRLLAIIHGFQVPNKLLLLDEPTIGLDTRGRGILFQLLEEATAQGKLIIVATNDSRIFSKMDSILVVKDCKPVLSGPTKDIVYQLSSATELIPNQVVRLVQRLEKRLEKDIPHVLNITEFNQFIGGEEN